MDGEKPLAAEWYYIGHYGELGPLTREQIDELVDGGVIARDTYVWRHGMTDWLPAVNVPDLSHLFRRSVPNLPPPPPSRPPSPPPNPASSSSLASAPRFSPAHPTFSPFVSDKSRTAGGLLQVIPGIGRIYLGYSAIGVLQLVLSLCGVGFVWSWIDGLVILAGGVRLDGYGRQLND